MSETFKSRGKGRIIMRMDFTEKKVLITGATRGIGERLASDFHALGADLLLTGTDKETINELNSQKQDRRQYFCVDFSDPESTNNFVNELEKYKRIDVCINNAGINRIDFFEQTKEKDFDDIVAVNLKGPYMVTRAISKLMKSNGYGRIINISSIWGVISKEKRSIYATTKFGIIGLTKTLSNEMAKYGVLVNAVSPGFVLTDLTRSTLSQKEMEELAGQVPIGRLAEPEDISSVVVFLASELNTYLTGKNIIVDGGFVDV